MKVTQEQKKLQAKTNWGEEKHPPPPSAYRVKGLSQQKWLLVKLSIEIDWNHCQSVQVSLNKPAAITSIQN